MMFLRLSGKRKAVDDDACSLAVWWPCAVAAAGQIAPATRQRRHDEGARGFAPRLCQPELRAGTQERRSQCQQWFDVLLFVEDICRQEQVERTSRRRAPGVPTHGTARRSDGD